MGSCMTSVVLSLDLFLIVYDRFTLKLLSAKGETLSNFAIKVLRDV